MRRGAGSLQRRLTLSIVAVVGIALALLSSGLFLQYRWFNHDRFDERLAAAARAAVSMVEDEGLAGRPDVGAIAAAASGRGCASVKTANFTAAAVIFDPLRAFREVGGLRPRATAAPTDEAGCCHCQRISLRGRF